MTEGEKSVPVYPYLGSIAVNSGLMMYDMTSAAEHSHAA